MDKEMTGQEGAGSTDRRSERKENIRGALGLAFVVFAALAQVFDACVLR